MIYSGTLHVLVLEERGMNGETQTLLAFSLVSNVTTMHTLTTVHFVYFLKIASFIKELFVAIVVTMGLRERH